MLEITPDGWFSSGYTVACDGAEIATLRFRVLREAGTLSLRGERLTVRRQGAASGEWRLQGADGRTLASAEKPSAWRNRIVVRAPDRPAPVRLQRRSAWGRAVDVVDGDRAVGSIRPVSMWSRRLVADLSGDLPEPLQLLAVWMVLLLVRRDASAAASSG